MFFQQMRREIFHQTLDSVHALFRPTQADCLTTIPNCVIH